MAGFMANQIGMRMLAPARRISKVAPVPGRRACAIVFDESPCAFAGETEAILTALAATNAKATFAVFGSTAENYPDRRGREGKESWRGVRYVHLPDFEADEKGGIAAHPELLAMLAAGGHEIALSGYRHLPASKPFLSRREAFADVQTVADDLKRALALTDAAGIRVSAYLPPMDAILLADGKSVYDACNAFSLNCLAPVCDFGSAFYTGTDAAAEAQRVLRAVKVRLASDPACFDGKLLRFSGGYCARLGGSVTPAVIGAVLELLSDSGYALLSVRELLEQSPFSDISPADACFASAKALLARGHTVCCRGNTFRPNASLTREALYAMLVPPHIMRDYMESRLYRTTAAFALNQKSEKELYMTPGTAVSAGMFYGYELGWPLERRQTEMTARSFAAFLDKASAGRSLSWTPPADAQLRRKDVIDVLRQFISEEETVQDGEE